MKSIRKALSNFAIGSPRITLAIAIAVGVVAVFLGAGTPDRLSNSESDFLSHGTESYKGAELLRTALGGQAFPDVAVIFPVGAGSKGNVLAEVQKVAHVIPQVYYSRNDKSVAILGYFDSGLATGVAAARLAQRLQGLPGVVVGGSALAGHQFSEQIKHDLVKTELIALPLLLLLAFWIFRSVVSAALPILAGGLTLVVALLVLRPINAIDSLSIFSLNVVTGVALGLSLDYSLLLVSRFREELAHGRDGAEAARVTVATAGRTVLISASTVTTAFASILVFPLGFLRSIAIGGIMVTIIAGFVSLTVLPAIFSLLGTRVNALAPRRWQRAAERSARPEIQGAWYRLARFVMRHPIPIAAGSMVLLLSFGIPALGMRLIGFDADALPANTSAHKFEVQAKREFTHSLFDEVVVIARGDEQEIHDIISRHIEKLPGIAAGEVKHATGNLWVFDIKASHPPFSEATKRLVRKIRALPFPLSVTGTTAAYIDTASTLRARLPLTMMIIATTTLIFLFIATGSVILPVKAVVMNLFSMTAAFGILVFVFQDGRFEGLLQYNGLGALALTQPILLGAGTFGIVTDYGIFMLTRIREGWDAGLSNREAIALGVERTGRIVTAAALLFCVAVGSLVTARLIFVKEIGIGVPVAVAVDATVVRAFLVPSLMTLLGKWNWWCPKLLRGRSPRLGVQRGD